jgi:hypothetical protein
MAVDSYAEQKENYKNMQSQYQQREQTTVQDQMENRLRFMEQVVEVKKTNPEIYKAMSKPIWTPELESLVYASDEGAKIVLYLGKNEAEAKRIADLDIDQMQNELELIEQRVKVQPRTVSGAPKALTPVDDAKHLDVKNIDDIKDDDEWFAARRREREKKFRKG